RDDTAGARRRQRALAAAVRGVAAGPASGGVTSKPVDTTGVPRSRREVQRFLVDIPAANANDEIIIPVCLSDESPSSLPCAWCARPASLIATSSLSAMDC